MQALGQQFEVWAADQAELRNREAKLRAEAPFEGRKQAKDGGTRLKWSKRQSQ